MPELPEVEVTRLSFANRIASAVITEVRLGKPLRFALGCTPERLIGLQVLQVRRRGKYLLLDLSGGLLIIHLGMSGRLTFNAQRTLLGSHDHFELQTTQGDLRLIDPRRFGSVVFCESMSDARAKKLLDKLGAEPLEEAFTQDYFYRGIHKRKSAIKQVLLSGQPVVGVGNIYASEALFHAGLRPTILASRLTKKQSDSLHSAVIAVLKRALELGGSTLRDFANAHGEDGHFQLQAAVYARAGQPCHSCGTAIAMIRQGQRSSFYCPHCQRPR